MKKLLILQNMILPYRKFVYNGLARDYDVTILHSGTPTVEPEDAYKEILMPALRIGPFFVQHGVFREISSGRYDVIISMFDLRWPAYILPVLKSRGRYGRWIFWGHWYGRRSYLNYARDWLMKKADAILLYGPEEIDRMIQRGLQGDKLFVADNTIHVPNHLDCSGHPKSSLLFVGSFKKRKKIDLLIEVFARIRKKVPENVQLEIVGDGPIRNFLREKVKEVNLKEKVVFHGGVNQHNLLVKIFSRAYAYVAPGNVGLGILHSFAYGIPVIAPVQPGEPWRHGPECQNLKHRVNGLIYKNERELEEMLIEICNAPRLSATLGQNAYRLYSSEKTLDIMLGGFREAIER